MFVSEAQSSPRLFVNPKGAKYPLLESKLLGFVRDARSEKLGVTTRMLRKLALELAPCCIIPDREESNKFKPSLSWVGKFIKRNNLSYRKSTHVSQQKKRDPKIVSQTLVNYLARLRKFFVYSIIINSK